MRREAKPDRTSTAPVEMRRGGSPLHSSAAEVSGKKERWPAIDVARGAAIAAMVAYHFAWDLSYLGFIETDVVAHRGWQLFARSIAASFLILVGIGLVLAHGGGVRAPAFLRRLAVIGGAALGITVVTWFVFPDEYIFFGILHCIAVSSVLALPFLRLPAAAVLAVAGFCFAAPSWFTDPRLDAPALAWLGLGSEAPLTNDYVPIFPWFGFVLMGLVAGRHVLPLAARLSAPGRLWTAAWSRGLIWAGRHSLAIYLVHQPVLLGGLLALHQATA
jgi:uncharacterized membrane protein